MSEVSERGKTGARWVRPFEWTAACVLLTAAGLKGLRLTGEPLSPGEAAWWRWLSGAWVEIELIWACLLLVGFRSVPLRVGSAILFAAFAAVSGVKGSWGVESCGCFGAVPVDPWLVTTVDLAFAVLFVAAAYAPPARDPGRKPLAMIAVVAAVIGLGLAALSNRWRLEAVADDPENAEGASVVILDPTRWLPLRGSLDVADEVARGRWELLFVRRGCPKCEDALRAWEAADRLEGGRYVVELPSENGPPSDSPAGVLRGRLSQDKKWVAQVPFQVVLVDGVVREARVK